MKRSEIIKILADRLALDEGYSESKEVYIAESECILDTLEKSGMLPPTVEIKSGVYTNEWEPEND